MRSDALGLFWQDEPPPPKEKKEKVVPTPPERTWELPDYLPNLEEARALVIDEYTGPELFAARGERMVFDIEVYPNFFLCGFRSMKTGKIAKFELYYGEWNDPYALDKMQWIAANCTLVGFNSYSFDVPIMSIAASGKATNAMLQDATQAIIVLEEKSRDVLKRMKVKMLKPDHIDLIEVAPLSASLKKYAGRLHSKRLQDLPFVPGTELSEDQVTILRWYWVNDLVNTQLVYDELQEQLLLREAMSEEYGLDLRSKSDAQVAEAVITAEVTKLQGMRPQRTAVLPGTVYQYRPPRWMRFQSALMQYVLSVVASTPYIVQDSGYVKLPQHIKDLPVQIAGGTYRMGNGGLHSSEESAAHVADDEFELIDIDMTSFYPFIILNLGLFPPHIGPDFLTVYRQIVDRRVAAKRAGNKVVADSLKITINGSFGKLGSPYSVLYAPDLLIQTTLTGQLTLLMLIERLELVGINVVSANTDGIVVKVRKSMRELLKAIVKQFEEETKFQTEETHYRGLYSRDVNNYIAVKTGGKGVKTKGTYANPWADPALAIFRFHKNPVTTVCVEAIENLLVKGVPITTTIRECNDIRKFVAVRDVKGGAWKEGVYLGKTVRWYYAAGETGVMIYANSGNKVPRSEGAKPLLDLPDSLPDDLDWDWYITETEEMLRAIGYT